MFYIVKSICIINAVIMCHYPLISEEYEQCRYWRRISRNSCFAEEGSKTTEISRVTFKAGELLLSLCHPGHSKNLPIRPVPFVPVCDVIIAFTLLMVQRVVTFVQNPKNCFFFFVVFDCRMKHVNSTNRRLWRRTRNENFPQTGRPRRPDWNGSLLKIKRKR